MNVAAALATGGLLILFIVLVGGHLDSRAWRRSLVAFQLTLPAGLTPEDVSRWLATVAAATQPPRLTLLPEPPLALEIVASRTGIEHVLLVTERMRATVLSGLRAALPGVRITEYPNYLSDRPRIALAGELSMTNLWRPLASQRAEAATAAVLAGLQPLAGSERIVLQWIMTAANVPRPVPNKTAGNRRDGLFNDDLRDSEAIHAARIKQSEPLLRLSGRLGVSADTQSRARALFRRSFAGLRSLNAPGVMVIRRWWLPSRLACARVVNIRLPLLFWPLSMSTVEAAALIGLPQGQLSLPGLTLRAARQLPPSPLLPQTGIEVGVANYPGMVQPLRLGTRDRLSHLHIIGPTGVGKSTLMARMALQDIAAGHSVIVIDPKADFCGDILDRIPDEHLNRITVLDPSHTEYPIGLNLLQAASDEQSRELVVDHVIHIYHELYKDFWGPRTEDVLRAALLTCINTRAADGSAFTLMELPDLLTNAPFRRFVLNQPTVPQGVRSFWTAYQSLKIMDRQKVIGPILNKLRAATLRSPIRLSLGQSHGLDLERLINQAGVLLAPLGKSTVGQETAALLGALLLSTVWQAILARAQVPAAARRPLLVYVDEAQDVLRLPVDVADMLAQARGFGAGFALAHQHLGQIADKQVRAALLGTVRSTVAFQLGWEDAATLARSFDPHLTADDLRGLGGYEFALRPTVDGHTIAPVTGVALPLPPASRDGRALADASRRRYGLARHEVEAALRGRLTMPGGHRTAGSQTSSHTPFGRRRRSDTKSGGGA